MLPPWTVISKMWSFTGELAGGAGEPEFIPIASLYIVLSIAVFSPYGFVGMGLAYCGLFVAGHGKLAKDLFSKDSDRDSEAVPQQEGTDSGRRVGKVRAVIGNGVAAGGFLLLSYYFVVLCSSIAVFVGTIIGAVA